MQNAQAMSKSQYQPADAAVQSDLGQSLTTLDLIHKTVTDLHSVADRACGMTGEIAGLSPTPAPAGMLGEVNESLHSLNSRLQALYSRISRIA